MSRWAGSNRLVWPALVFTLALCLRLIVVGRVHLTPYGDAKQYKQIALHLLEGEGFSLKQGIPTAFRPPLYPLLLAGTYAVMGEGNDVAVHILQAILSALVCVFVWVLADQAFGRSAAWPAAALAVVSPELLLYCGVLLAEVPSFLLLLMTVLAARSSARGSNWLTGLCLSAAALTRPAMAFFVPGLIAWKGCSHSSSVAERRRWLGGFVLAFALGLTPWIARNAVVFKRFIPLTTHAGYDLWFANRPGSWGGATTGYAEDPVRTFKGDEVARDRFAKTLALRAIRQDPVRYLKLCLYRVSVAFSPGRESLMHRIAGISSPAMNEAFLQAGATERLGKGAVIPTTLLGDVYPGVFFVIVMVAAVIGVACMAGRFHADRSLLVWTVGSYLVCTSLIVQEIRYRAAVMPLLFPLAGYGMAHLRPLVQASRWGPARRRALAASLGIVLLLCANSAYHLLNLNLPGSMR